MYDTFTHQKNRLTLGHLSFNLSLDLSHWVKNIDKPTLMYSVEIDKLVIYDPKVPNCVELEIKLSTIAFQTRH